MKTKKLLVLALLMLLVVGFASTVNAASAGAEELCNYLNTAHEFCGKTYELTAEQKKTASDYILSKDIDDLTARLVMTKLDQAVNDLKKTGATDMSQVSKEVKERALRQVQSAGEMIGVKVNFDSNSKIMTVINSNDGTVLGSSKIVSSSNNTNTVNILEGANQLYNVADAGELKFRLDVDYQYFDGKVYMDDKFVDPNNYTSESGSTIIKFKPEYAKTLSLGDHTLKVEFTNGKVGIVNFKATHVTGGGPAPAGSATAAGPAFVYTGSNTNVAYIVVSLLAVAAVSIAFVKKVYVK